MGMTLFFPFYKNTILPHPRLSLNVFPLSPPSPIMQCSPSPLV